jgi:phosphoribosylaminoimidazole-succinocarboxamide synthase
VYSGKTKDVYARGDGTILLRFKDDATVGEDGQIDPGGNTVGARIEGLGRASLRMTRHYFELLRAAGVPTHYLDSNIDAGTMTVRAAQVFGKGVEVICRLKATGSFIRRYGDYCTEGADLDRLVEVSLKDDARGDPMASVDTLELLGIMTRAEYDAITAMTKQIAVIVRDDVAAKGLTLYDFKVEFGRAGGEIIVIDEISAGCMRVYRDGAWLSGMELSTYYTAW